ncbi:MAG: hypothetical protein QOF13_640 [Solirubrobacterales bacterium]|jgi:AcrR family transcriptional regulator|nr:hypothetical protein [Solirubrobacterales bacterium]
MDVRARRSEETAQRIREVALERFLSRSYDEVTLAEVAEAAGVTVPTLIAHFGRKEDLFAAVLEDWGDRMIESRDEAPVGDHAGRIRNLLDHYDTEGNRILHLLAEEAVAPPHRSGDRANGRCADRSRLMARVLVYTAPGSGHAYPPVATAIVLRDRGHEVTIRTASGSVDAIGRLGLSAAPIDPRIEAIALEDWKARTPIGALMSAGRTFVRRADYEIPDLQAAIETERPDRTSPLVSGRHSPAASSTARSSRLTRGNASSLSNRFSAMLAIATGSARPARRVLIGTA